MEHTDQWFNGLYRRYARSMLRAANVLLGNYAVAEEIVHDVFVILLLKRKEVEQYQSPGVWLFRTLNNRVANEMQRARNTREVPLQEEHAEAVHMEEETHLADVLPRGLSDMERQFLIWYYEDNLSHEEIAERMKISVHASHGRLYRLKKKCFQLMTQEKKKEKP